MAIIANTPTIVALRKESVDRNIRSMTTRQPPERSLSARRAWIEMRGSISGSPSKLVALRKESVDRNISLNSITYADPVALRKESVDRNISNNPESGGLFASLSARRAWIEMLYCVQSISPKYVALRKESVDRNKTVILQLA